MSEFRDLLNVYRFSCVLPGSKEEIEFKPITTGQIKKLLTYENEQNPLVQEKALDEIIKEAVVTKDFNIDEMFLQDRFFFLIELRKKTKGETYEFQLNCPKCKSQSLQRIKLDELKVKPYEEKDNLVVLDENVSVRLKHLKRKDTRLAFKTITGKMNDKQIMAEMQINSYVMGIESIITKDKELKDIPFNDRKYFVEGIPTGLVDKIKDWYNENDFGVDFKYDIVCPNCYFTEKIDIPMDNFFF